MNTQEIAAKGFKGLVITGLISMLIACGGGGGGGGPLASQSVVTKGVITGLGSIWVNGVEYETPDGGSYSSDDSSGSTASDQSGSSIYQVGQVVRLRGRRNDDGVSGTASEVEYEAEVEGAATTGVINGVTILITPTTNVSGASLNGSALKDGFRYEVSGFWLDNNTIEATFIKNDDDSDSIDEIKGFVEASAPGSLTVHGVIYTYSGTPAVAVGDFVEIHFNGTAASRVDLEDDFSSSSSSGQEVEFEGTVNMDPTDLAGCPTGADFLIDQTCIDWDSVPSSGWMDGLTDKNDMMPGLRVEAEGHFNSAGLLIAEKIKGRGNRVRITAVASNVVSGTFDVFGGAIQVTTSSLTDSSGATIADGNGLEIRGIRTGPTSVLAIRIKGVSVNVNRQILRAKVDLDGADSATDLVTVMGISSSVSSTTELKDEGTVIASTPSPAEIDSYLDSIDDDNIVNTTNGPRDVLKVRINTTSGDGSSGNPYAAKQIEIEREDD